MKTLKFFVAAVAALMALACTQEEIDVLTMGSTEINVSYQGVEQTLEFNTNAAWKIESDEDWVTLDVEEGKAGDASVVMTVAANTTYEARTATVTVTAGGLFSEYVIKQGFASVFGAEMEYNYDFMPQILEVALNTNVEYEVSVSEGAESWITSDALTKAAPVKETLTFLIALNSGADRSGEITITAGDNVQTIVVNQTSFEGTVMTSVENATFLGQTSYIFDDVSYSYNEFDEYYLEFANESGDKLSLSLNAEMAEGMSGIPVGDYFAGSESHEVGTFTISSGTAKYFTAATVGGVEVSVVDGSVSVSVDGKTYKVIAELVDETGVSYGFAYIGEIAEIEDNSFGVRVAAKAIGQWSTYFTTKANEYDLEFFISKKNPTCDLFMRYFRVTLFADKDADLTNIPEGTYTLTTAETSTEVSYPYGKLLADPGMITSISSNDNLYNNIEVLAAQMDVTRNTDGTYNFALDMKIRSAVWNDDYTEMIYGPEFDYVAEFTDVEVGDVPFTGTLPAPDGDVEFKSITMGGLQGYSFGDKFETGGNFFFLQNTYINGCYSMYLMLNQSGAYTINNQPRNGYSNVSIEEGTYTYSATPTAGEKQMLRAKYSSYTNTIQNTYTGTLMTITGGSVTYRSGVMTVDLVASDAAGKEYKITGTFSNPFQQVRDYSANENQLKKVSLITE